MACASELPHVTREKAAPQAAHHRPQPPPGGRDAETEPAAGRGAGAPAGGRSFRLLAHGDCALSVAELRHQRLLIASYRTRRGTVSRLVSLRDGRLRVDADLYQGLPLSGASSIEGRLAVDGTWPDDAWLTRVRVNCGSDEAPLGQAACYGEYTIYRWQAGWTQSGCHPVPQSLRGSGYVLTPAASSSHCAPNPGTAPLDAVSLCGDPNAYRGLSGPTTVRLRSGHVFTGGRCSSLRMAGGSPFRVVVARWDPEEAVWEGGPLDLPRNLELHAGLILLALSPSDAYAAVPASAEAYLYHYDGSDWARVNTLASGPITSLAAAGDQSLWLTSEGAVWSRSATGDWQAAELPAAPSGDCFSAERVVLAGEDELWIQGSFAASSGARHSAVFTTADVGYAESCARWRPRR
jgi:hypothetical protein